MLTLKAFTTMATFYYGTAFIVLFGLLLFVAACWMIRAASANEDFDHHHKEVDHNDRHGHVFVSQQQQLRLAMTRSRFRR